MALRDVVTGCGAGLGIRELSFNLSGAIGSCYGSHQLFSMLEILSIEIQVVHCVIIALEANCLAGK